MIQKKKELSAYDKLKLFENRYPEIVREYQAYMSQSDAQKEKARKEWVEYYDKCATSPAAEFYREMKDAFRFNRFDEIKERTQWAKEMREQQDFMPKPKSIDPFAFANSEPMLTYNSLLAAWKQEQMERDAIDAIVPASEGGIFS